MPTERERAVAFRQKRAEIQRSKIALFRNTRQSIIDLLNEAHERILAQLAGLGQFDEFFPVGLDLARLEQAVRIALTEFGVEAGQTVSRDIGQAWQLGHDLVDHPLQAGGFSIEAIAPSIDTNQLRAMRAFTTNRIRGASTDMVDRINRTLGLTLIGAQTPGNAVAQVSDIIQRGGRARAIAIVRTELGRAFATATQERLEQVAKVVPGMQKQWRRSGKIHSRLVHDAIDGQVRDVDESFEVWNKRKINLKFPRDPKAPIGEVINCGCDSLPYREEWEVRNKGKRPFTERELEDPKKQQLDKGVPIQKIV